MRVATRHFTIETREQPAECNRCATMRARATQAYQRPSQQRTSKRCREQHCYRADHLRNLTPFRDDRRDASSVSADTCVGYSDTQDLLQMDTDALRICRDAVLCRGHGMVEHAAATSLQPAAFNVQAPWRQIRLPRSR